MKEPGTVTVSWPQIVATVDLPEANLDEATRKRLAEHIEEALWEVLSAGRYIPPQEPSPTRCKCRGPFYHDAGCWAWCT